jgi:hypothetical protein
MLPSRLMHAAFLLGAVLIMGLIVADWMVFNRKSPASVRYGVVVGRREEPLVVRRDRFDAEGLLQLPRGWARLVPEHRAVQLLPDRKRFGIAVRTAWPLNGYVHYAALDEQAAVMLTKRMPWSSVLVTGAWFLTVLGGTLVYFVAYALAGGLSSASGAFLGIFLSGVGLLVCLFGLVVVAAAYRLEDKRLMALYAEFCSALAAHPRPSLRGAQCSPEYTGP